MLRSFHRLPLFRLLLVPPFIAVPSVWLLTPAQSPAQPPAAGAVQPCTVVRPGVKVPCPPDWNLLKEEADDTVVANFPRTLESRNRLSGPGMATITVFSMPKNYETLARWIAVSRKNVADASESKSSVVNETAGKTQVTCLDSPESRGPAFASCFFQLGRTPVLIELNFQAQDPQKDRYRMAVQRMIEQAVPVR